MCVCLRMFLCVCVLFNFILLMITTAQHTPPNPTATYITEFVHVWESACTYVCVCVCVCVCLCAEVCKRRVIGSLETLRDKA